MVQTLSESDHRSEISSKMARDHFDRIKASFIKNIDIGIQKGEFLSNTSLEDLANHLVIIMQGLLVSSKIYSGEKLLNVFLSVLSSVKNTQVKSVSA